MGRSEVLMVILGTLVRGLLARVAGVVSRSFPDALTSVDVEEPVMSGAR